MRTGRRFCTAAAAACTQVVGDDIMRLGYSGGTTGKPKALASVQRTGVVTVQIIMAEWKWPSPPKFLCCTLLSHAGAAMLRFVIPEGLLELSIVPRA